MHHTTHGYWISDICNIPNKNKDGIFKIYTTIHNNMLLQNKNFHTAALAASRGSVKVECIKDSSSVKAGKKCYLLGILVQKREH